MTAAGRRKPVRRNGVPDCRDPSTDGAFATAAEVSASRSWSARDHAWEYIFVAPVPPALQRRPVARSDFQQQIARAVDSGLRGEFDQPTDGDRDLGQIAGRMKQLLAGVSSAVSEVSGMMRRIAGGDLSARIGGHHHGVFAEVARDANTAVECLSQIVDEIDTATATSTCLWICNFPVSPNRRI